MSEDVSELPKELEVAKTKAVEIIVREGGITPNAIIKLTAQETVLVQNTITYDDAQQIMSHFEKRGYVTKSGKIKNRMKYDIQNGILDLPPRFESAREQLVATICRANTKPPVRDASRDVMVCLKKQLPYRRNFWNCGIRLSKKQLTVSKSMMMN